MAIAPGSEATSQAAASTSAFAPTRANAGIACCASIFSAPLCRSPETRRIATNGSRKTAATSNALNVGAQMPTSGENASPTPADVPLNPLASAYVRTALMNVTPTSGPIASSSTHHAHDAISSRYSLRSNHRKAAAVALAPSGERKEHLFEIVAGCRAAGGGERGEFLQ